MPDLNGLLHFWILSPYLLVLGIVASSLTKQALGAGTITSAAFVCALPVAYYAYAFAFLESGTLDGLLFVLVPISQLLALCLFIGIGSFFGRQRKAY